MPEKDKHVHKFVKPKTEKSVVSGKNTMAIDTLLQRVCKCGKVETYDLVRKKTI